MSYLGSRGDFEQNGYWYGPKLLTEIELTDARRHFDDVLAGRYDLESPPAGVNRFGNVMVKVANAWWCDSVIRRIVLDPRIASIAATLLNVEELYLWADSLYWKAPLAHSEQAQIGWHQDKQYWAMSPTDRMITATVALYHGDALSGALRFARGSNRWGLVGGSDALVGEDNAGQHNTPPVPPGERWTEVCESVAPGQVTFHHCLTFHGSGPNLSEEPRRSITIHMVASEGRAAGARRLYPE